MSEARQTPAPADFIAGGGEMGAAIRSFDWEASSLGPVARWPQALRTVLRILLTSRYAMWLAWGRELTFFCNDAYRPTLGQKAGWALGSPAQQVWAEIWPEIGPRIEHVLRSGEATWDDGLLLFLERSGYPEETYHTFSYSPAPDDAGGVAGMLCVVAEETERVLSERRLATLARLAAALGRVQGQSELWETVAHALAENARDLPFTLIGLYDPDGQARIVARTGLAPGDAWDAATDADGRPLWPAQSDLAAGMLRLDDLEAHARRAGGPVPTGSVWTEPARLAVVLPLAGREQGRPAGFMVAGVNPFRPLDAAYADFIQLAAGQISAGFARVRAYEDERRRAEALAELDRTKTAFFANVSHEFRTPLTLMLAPLEDALNDAAGPPLPGPHRQRLEIAHRNSLRLLKLVNVLLDFSSLEAGRLRANFQPVDLAALTADIASGFRTAMERAGLRLDIDCETLAEPVYVDVDMWEKIALNLLSNAFKFTFAGGVTVALRQHADSVTLEVRDTGVGIPEHELPRVFERFHRVAGQRSRSFEGSGIGLALSYELVKQHGGAMQARSAVGSGASFLVTLPLGHGHLPADRIAAPAQRNMLPGRRDAYVEEALRWLPDVADGADPEAGLAPAPGDPHDLPRVLVADDNADMRAYIGRVLGGRYRVSAVGDGAAALAALRREPPALLVSDVMMPGLDGFALLAEIRADPALRALPVVLLSARAGEEARSEGLDGGADDYLTKPFSARELLARVGANLAMARLRQDVGEALRVRTAELETLLDTVPICVWFTSDPQGRTVQSNRAAATLLRIPLGVNASLAAPIGERLSHFRVLRAGQHVTAEQLPLRRAARGEEVADEELEIRFDDGSSRILRLQARAIRRADGAFAGAVCVATDETEQKLAEAALRRLNEGLEARVEARTQDLRDINARLMLEMAERERVEDSLRQSQKMEAVGQLTGGIAHDFNNLLTGIIGSLELLQARAAQGRIAELGRYVAAAQGAANRAAALTHRLLAFSRRQTLQPKAVNANRLVADMEDLVRRTIGPAIQLEAVKAGGLWTTLCDPNQLENALLNLCINARDAMPDGGRLTIETENAFLDQFAARDRDIAAGQYVAIHVTDTGVGMAPEVAARAFDPFFTTKPLGQGTGLGLSMIYGFVRQSGGQVRIYSEVGRGTSVKLYLPRHQTAEAAEADVGMERVADLRAQANETVLIVDDEPTVRMLVAEVLSDLGYHAIEAEDAPSGLRILAGAPRIDLLITDVGLPGGMNGRQLADVARARRPELKVLFITGYAENAVFGNGILEAGMQVIAKPFAMDMLATRIRMMIAGG